MTDVINTWPTKWLEAAISTGFAHYEGNGRFVFVSDELMKKLAEFASLIDQAARIPE